MLCQSFLNLNTNYWGWFYSLTTYSLGQGFYHSYRRFLPPSFLLGNLPGWGFLPNLSFFGRQRAYKGGFLEPKERSPGIFRGFSFKPLGPNRVVSNGYFLHKVKGPFLTRGFKVLAVPFSAGGFDNAGVFNGRRLLLKFPKHAWGAWVWAKSSFLGAPGGCPSTFHRRISTRGNPFY